MTSNLTSYTLGSNIVIQLYVKEFKILITASKKRVNQKNSGFKNKNEIKNDF